MNIKKLPKFLLLKLMPLFDIVFAPLTVLASVWLKIIRQVMFWGYTKKIRISKKIFMKVGVFPIMDHYYEPLFKSSYLRYPLTNDRALPGIDLNVAEQLETLRKFAFNDELTKIPNQQENPLEFYYKNLFFGTGDSEYFYNLIRLFKPNRIIEIGSGYSTLMAINAIKKNRAENNSYDCKITCIEPYENDWLEKLGINILRETVEKTDKAIFKELRANDILFIDSSHVIRPQGDVLFEYLEILPVLNSAVLVHIHDIYTPKDYPEELLVDYVRFWNEQYLLEAFLSGNREFKVIGSLNYLMHDYFAELTEKCPILKQQGFIAEPSSFWILKK